MAMTAAVKDELAHLEVTKPCCRKAEVSAMLRFAGGLHIVGGRIVVEAEVDNGATARRLRKDIAEVYGHPSEVAVLGDPHDVAAALAQPSWRDHRDVGAMAVDLGDVLAQPPSRRTGVDLGFDDDAPGDDVKASGEPQHR